MSCHLCVSTSCATGIRILAAKQSLKEELFILLFTSYLVNTDYLSEIKYSPLLPLQLTSSLTPVVYVYSQSLAQVASRAPLLAQLLHGDSHPQAASASALPESLTCIFSRCPSRLSTAATNRSVCYELPSEAKKPAWFPSLTRIHTSRCQVLHYACWRVRPGMERQWALTFEDKMQLPSWSFLSKVQCIKEKLIYKSNAGHKAIIKIADSGYPSEYTNYCMSRETLTHYISLVYSSELGSYFLEYKI